MLRVQSSFAYSGFDFILKYQNHNHTVPMLVVSVHIGECRCEISLGGAYRVFLGKREGKGERP